MQITWQSYADHLNYQTYAVWKPTSYMRIPDTEPNGELAASHFNNDVTLNKYGAKTGKTVITSPSYRPFFEPDNEEYSNARVTIADMSDMFFHKIKFTILDDNELLMIVELVEGYLNWARGTTFADSAFKVFNDRLTELYNSLKYLQKRTCAKMGIPIPNNPFTFANLLHEMS